LGRGSRRNPVRVNPNYPTAEVTLLTEEPCEPYEMPPLSNACARAAQWPIGMKRVRYQRAECDARARGGAAAGQTCCHRRRTPARQKRAPKALLAVIGERARPYAAPERQTFDGCCQATIVTTRTKDCLTRLSARRSLHYRLIAQKGCNGEWHLMTPGRPVPSRSTRTCPWRRSGLWRVSPLAYSAISRTTSPHRPDVLDVNRSAGHEAVAYRYLFLNQIDRSCTNEMPAPFKGLSRRRAPSRVENPPWPTLRLFPLPSR
jgi:hypothetical protein